MSGDAAGKQRSPKIKIEATWEGAKGKKSRRKKQKKELGRIRPVPPYEHQTTRSAFTPPPHGPLARRPSSIPRTLGDALIWALEAARAQSRNSGNSRPESWADLMKHAEGKTKP